MKIYAPELIDHTDESSSISSDDEETNEIKQEKELDPSPQKYLYQILDQINEIHNRISNLEMKRGASGDILGQIKDHLQEFNSTISCIEKQKGVSGDILGTIFVQLHELNSKILFLEKQKGVLGDNSEEPENK
ncbi:hypothetical protein M9Y10_036006 [Tritrichomonas musculus]|uniref:Uncharacterized protein n=1 Tax=Tritrichomonas musculus TaxID=1915356 RepID=A0ABR2GWM0_9EUKA